MFCLPSPGKLYAPTATERTAMTSKERKLWEQALWEQAIRVLRQNSVTVRAPAAKQAPPADAPKRVA